MALSQDKMVTAKVMVYGNCETCKNKIEQAASKKDHVKSSWNQEDKILTISFDEQKTNKDEILKRVAYAGYDNELYLAPEKAYESLPACCKYKRKKTPSMKEEHQHAPKDEHEEHKPSHDHH